MKWTEQPEAGTSGEQAAFAAWRAARLTAHSAYDRARRLVPLDPAGRLPEPGSGDLSVEQRAALLDLAAAEREVRLSEDALPDSG